MEPTVPVLVKVLRDHQNPNRARAATILARMGAAAKAAAPALIAVTQEPFSYTRVKAEEALKQMSAHRRPKEPTNSNRPACQK